MAAETPTAEELGIVRERAVEIDLTDFVDSLEAEVDLAAHFGSSLVARGTYSTDGFLAGDTN